MPRRAVAFAIIALIVAASSGCIDNGAPSPPATVPVTPSTTNASPPPSTAAIPPPLRTITIAHDGGEFTAEVADDAPERTLGLSGRAALAPGTGMLFVWDPPAGAHQLWMKDMQFPLDLVWLDGARTIVEITRGVQPQPGASNAELTLYAPAAPVRYAIELHAGDAARMGLAVGEVLLFEEGTD